MIAAVEDVLSEVIVRKVVGETRRDLTIYQVMRKNGSGYVRSKLRELNRTARNVPVFVVIDLDRPVPCPAELIRVLLPVPLAPKLLLRIAVMEIESWVMADRERFARFLGVAQELVPPNPDDEAQPKERIVALARQSNRREIRADLVPARGDTRVVGPAYNARLTAFVRNEWRLSVARRNSPSLDKAVQRLRVAF